MAILGQQLLLGLVAMVAVVAWMGVSEAALGVNYGTMSSHLLPPKVVARLLRANNITRVKLFDADFAMVRAFAGTDIEVMVAIPNDMLEMMATSTDAAERWVKRNVTRFLIDGGVKIKYVAVGNEPFLTAYNGSFISSTLPAAVNIHQALVKHKVADEIKVTVPLNADVLSNGGVNVPSAGIFRPDIQDIMSQLVAFLDQNQCPFTINLYPFLSLQQDANFPREFAFFDGALPPTVDGALSYTNVFDASYDLLVSALRKNGFGNVSILVGEVGWPTDGDPNANMASAQRFYRGLATHVGRGTPLSPRPLDVYLFSLTDEDQKSIAPGNFERHWGIYTFDGQAKYQLDLSGSGSIASLVNAPGVDYLPRKWCVLDPAADRTRLGDNVAYACMYADCTSLMYGGSCNGIGGDGNASYAFNSYYQLKGQMGNSCYFDGLGKVTDVDPSQGDCKFRIGIVTAASPPPGLSAASSLLAASLAFLFLLF
ncbi:hypothetical protein SELMODRAFT_86140 [Selaginella moellendorffii]|uniref:glucan endo-1,3-beta-D-glucosidase n=1 Tax=Selaginella moellendorffii TaxID=88036 RepID=D8R679_SELML|nr:glucan endo-1,3-beta-glucosidase 8 [Selaginella moellendorffii]EFJ32621.1 hypothetical protein SELMODRAFT_86140 [Selaginella moellendorffii]|eukprot:XP_002966594.1 glucan endo-1,3-beta-glucosidase 8 [Selaginella moellendorffii]